MSVQGSSNILKINPATGLAGELGRTKMRYDAHATTRRDEERGRRRTTKTKTLRSHRNNTEAAQETRRTLDQQAKAGRLPVIDLIYKDHDMDWVTDMDNTPSMDLMVFEEDIPRSRPIICPEVEETAAEWNAKHGVWDEAYEARLAQMEEQDRIDAMETWHWGTMYDNLVLHDPVGEWLAGTDKSYFI